MRTRTAVLGCLIALWLGATGRPWSTLPGVRLMAASNFADALEAYLRSRVEADVFSGATGRSSHMPLAGRIESEAL
jgi:hypothetical protein